MNLRQNHKHIDEYIEMIESVALELSETIPDLKDSDKREALLVSICLSGMDNNYKRALSASEFKADPIREYKI